MHHPNLKWLLPGLVLGSALLSAVAWRVLSHVKQHETSVQLEHCAVSIAKALVADGLELTLVNAEAALQATCFPRDRWGHTLVVVVHVQPLGPDLLVVSPGRDGALDVEDVALYAMAQPRNVSGDFDHDLVNVNGEPWFYVGH